MRFSLLHPSRGRLKMADAAIAEWTGQASVAHPIEYILSVDADDDVAGYRALAERRGLTLLVNANRSMVDATNRAAGACTGDVLIVVSDDFGCPAHWDRQIAAVLGGRRDAGVLVNDGGEARIMTLPILGRELYERLGYVFHPAYFSMYCDDDLTLTIRGWDKLIDARHLLFLHRHFQRGLAPLDATYARENSADAWWSGWRVFEKRRAVDFGRRPRTLWARTWELAVEARYWTYVAGVGARCGVSRARSIAGRLRSRLR